MCSLLAVMMSSISIGSLGEKISFRSHGEGSPLVLLHGFLESSFIWSDLEKTWSRKRQVVCIDLPGHGASDVLAAEHGMELMAQSVMTVLNHLKLSQVELLGHSMGGYVALALLELYPERVSRIGLMNSSTAADSPERKENRERSVELVTKNKPAFVSMALKNLLPSDNYRIHKDSIEKMKNHAIGFPTEGIVAALLGMKNRTDRSDVLGSFTGTKYFISGRRDSLLPAEESKKQAITSGAVYFEVDGGHLSYLGNKMEVEEIVQFID